MNFFDSLNDASFRGFGFSVQTDDKRFGRDVKPHKYMNGTHVGYEDVGVQPKTFTVEAVIGGSNDFIELADKFEAILSQKGTGKLILPYLNEIDAIVISPPRRKHSSDEVGIVRFSIIFEQVILDKVPQVNPLASKASLLSSVTSGNFAVVNDFIANYISPAPDFINEEVFDKIENLTNTLGQSLSRISIAFKTPNLIFSKATLLAGGIIDLFQGVVSPLKTKTNFTVANVTNSSSVPDDVIALVEILSGDELSALEEVALENNTTSESVRNNNINAINLLNKIAALNAALEAAAYAEYESTKEALRLRHLLLAQLNAARLQAGERSWIASYNALTDSMAAITRDIDEKLGRLPLTATIKSTISRSSYLLAHRLYGDNPSEMLNKSDDIVQRNNIIHPLFLPSDDLEVLINV